MDALAAPVPDSPGLHSPGVAARRQKPLAGREFQPAARRVFLGDIVHNVIPISDGVIPSRRSTNILAFFALLGLAVRLLGKSEFALRLLSVAAATLFVPVCWALARRLVRRGCLPPAAPTFAGLLAAVSPFYLWYGQEVRMYAQVGFLAILTLYLLLRWTEAGDRRSLYRWLIGYLVALALLLSSHYYSVLILPVQAALISG